MRFLSLFPSLRAYYSKRSFLCLLKLSAAFRADESQEKTFINSTSCDGTSDSRAGHCSWRPTEGFSCSAEALTPTRPPSILPLLQLFLTHSTHQVWRPPSCHRPNQCSRPSLMSPLTTCPSRNIQGWAPPSVLFFIILINQEPCTCLSVLLVALSRKKREVIKAAGEACWGLGLGQRWWCESDKMNWIQTPKLSLNPLLPPPSLSSPEALARSGQVGKELMKPHLCRF